MSNTRLYTGLCGTLALLLPACGGVIKSSDSSSDTEGQMTLNECSNGFGQLVPYTVHKLSNGVPTSQIISIRTVAELVDNVTPANPILPPPQFPETALLPSGLAGNHFIYANLTQAIDVSTVLEPSPGGLATSGLTGAVTVTAVDPLTGDAQTIPGRAFIDGQTYELPIQANGQLTLQRWVELDPFGNPSRSRPRASAFRAPKARSTTPRSSCRRTPSSSSSTPTVICRPTRRSPWASRSPCGSA